MTDLDTNPEVGAEDFADDLSDEALDRGGSRLCCSCGCNYLDADD